MMLPPDPGVLDTLVRDRQSRLRIDQVQRRATAPTGMRVRLGHALIVAGSTLSGERVEIPARRSSPLRA